MSQERLVHPLYRGRPSGRPVPGAMQWLKEHWDEYAGRWVAVGPTCLVADGASLEEVERQVDSFQGLLLAHVV